MNLPGYPINVRFSDLDSYGVVNNAIYLTYFEEARMLWTADHIEATWDWKKQGIILAHHEIDYKLPIFLGDKPRMILWISDIGSKSFEVSYQMIKLIKDKWVKTTDGKSVVVCFDYQNNKPMEIPETWRAVLEKNREPEAY